MSGQAAEKAASIDAEVKGCLEKARAAQHEAEVKRQAAESWESSACLKLMNAAGVGLRGAGVSFTLKTFPYNRKLVVLEVNGDGFTAEVYAKAEAASVFEAGVRIAAAVAAAKAATVPPLPDLRTAVDINREYDEAHPPEPEPPAPPAPEPAQGEML